MKKYPTIQVITPPLDEENYVLTLQQLKYKVLTGIKCRYFLYHTNPNNLTPAHILEVIKDYKIQVADMEPLRASSAIGKTTRQYVHFSSLCANDKLRLAVDIINAILAYKEVNND